MTRAGSVQVDKAAESVKATELPVFSVDLWEAARRSESEVSDWVPERLDEAIQRYRKFFHLASMRNVRCGVFRHRDADLWRPDIDCLIPAG